jgi:hypothetical protein
MNNKQVVSTMVITPRFHFSTVLGKSYCHDPSPAFGTVFPEHGALRVGPTRLHLLLVRLVFTVFWPLEVPFT